MGDEIELPPGERYELQKIRILNEVQDSLVDWGKKKAGLLVVVFALMGAFGINGFINLVVGDKIEQEMVAVDASVLAAVKSAVEAEVSARRATASAEAETRRLSASADALSATVDSIGNQARIIEERLALLADTIEAASGNVRAEARLLVEGIERRVDNLETISRQLSDFPSLSSYEEFKDTIDNLTSQAINERTAFEKYSLFGVQITYEEGSYELAHILDDLLGNIGFRTSMYTNLSAIESVWGVKLDYLEGQVTILHPPSNREGADTLANILRTRSGIENLKIGVDRNSHSDTSIGLLIPPDFQYASNL